MDAKRYGAVGHCCGSGVLTIACAKRNPAATFIGIDRWGKEYASFNKPLCENNAKAEGVNNISFERGDATHLDFPDLCFLAFQNDVNPKETPLSR